MCHFTDNRLHFYIDYRGEEKYIWQAREEFCTDTSVILVKKKKREPLIYYIESKENYSMIHEPINMTKKLGKYETKLMYNNHTFQFRTCYFYCVLF